MRRIFRPNMLTLLLCLVGQILGSLLLWLFYIPISGQAHAAAPITPSGLNTQVNLSQTPPPGKTQYDITGGTRPGGGVNLFHSFGDFNVPNNNIANFLNETALPTSNILGRVTGGNISNIFGTIQTTGFGNANLFMMNPMGFLFGPNATLNVGGMVSFTSADYLRLADGVRFNAVPDAAADALLTAAPVAAFGFLGSNPGAITVQGSQFTVTPGTGISLVGGNITVQNGTLDTGTVQAAKLSAPGGQIQLASVASPGEILAGNLAQAPNINGQSFGNLGTIQVTEQSVIDVSGNGGGTVSIRGGQFVLDNSTISANVTGPGPVINGAEAIGGGIDIQVSQKAAIQNAAVLETNVLGNATPGVTYGGTHVKADRIEILGSQDFVNLPFTGIRSGIAPGSTGGNSGNITLEANSILMQGHFILMQGQTVGPLVAIESGTLGAGNAGNIALRAVNNLELDGRVNIRATSGDIDRVAGDIIEPSGNAGNIELRSTGGNILMTNGPFMTTSSVISSGKAGSITVSAPNGDILLAGVPNELFAPGSLFTSSDLDNISASGGIQITAKNLTLANAAIAGDNFSPFVPGNITVTLSGTLTLNGQSNTFIQTVARSSARSADLNITAHEVLVTDGAFLSTRTVRSGNGGALNIFADSLQLTGGGQIRSGTAISNPRRPVIPTGAGGTVNIQGLAGPAESVLIDGASSGIFTNTVGTGAGGNTNIAAHSVTIQNGGTISADTSGTAPSATGGAIIINATDGVTLTNNAHVTSSSTGPGIAGDVTINAGNQFAMTNSSVTTEASHSSGGAIKITTNPNGTVELTDSTISASVLDGTGGGGSVNIDPQFVLLQNSQIKANAEFGPGGNIFITTNLLLPDSTSIISASSQFGQQGTITIQQPIAPASGKIIPLPQKPLVPISLLSQRCAALAQGNISSFTIAGRDSLPAEPSSWLSSPLAMASAGPGPQKMGERSVALGMGEGEALRADERREAGGDVETPVLSLRRIAPPGFLTQSFAVDWSGCTS